MRLSAAALQAAKDGDTRLVTWPLIFPFRYIGFEVLQPLILHGIGGVSAMEAHEDGMSDLDRYQQQWRQMLENLPGQERIAFNADEDFDERTRLKSDAPSYSPFIAHKD